MPCEAHKDPDTIVTYLHIKGCKQCRAAWPLMTNVLDQMNDYEVRNATPQIILERGLATTGPGI